MTDLVFGLFKPECYAHVTGDPAKASNWWRNGRSVGSINDFDSWLNFHPSRRVMCSRCRTPHQLHASAKQSIVKIPSFVQT